MDFDESAHKFTVSRGNVQQLEFGDNWFLTTLIRGLSIDLMDRAASGRSGLYGRGEELVHPALYFHAECIVLTPRGPAPEFQLRNDYDFGFVQGMRNANIHLEYWGKAPSQGRTMIDIDMPNVFEIDTDPRIKPWTRAASSRFNILRVSHGSTQRDALKITAEFEDHPMYSFRHTLPHELLGVLQFYRYIRWVFFRREFRTVFCFRNKRTGNFTPISATGYFVDYNHWVSYSDGGSTRSVTATTTPIFPLGGSPSHVNALDRSLMAMAKAGTPLCTPADLKARITDSHFRTETEEANNTRWVSFWT